MSQQRATRSRRERICSWCPMTFSKEEHLARHERSHTKEKPFSCDTCRRSFSRHDSLLRHARMHGHQLRGRSASTASLENSPSAAHSAFRGPAPLSTQRLSRQEQPSLSAVHDATTASYTIAAGPSLANTTNSAQDQFPDPLAAIPSSSPRCHSAVLDPTLEASSLAYNVFPETATWLVGEDFDLDALNLSVVTNGLDSFPSETTVQENVFTSLTPQPSDEEPGGKEEQVRQIWFTYIGIGKNNGQFTPTALNSRPELDEQDRQSLALKLQPSVSEEPLPSTDFLNLCTHLFFTKFNFILPIVHAPTFRPSSESSLLLLSICSIGSLFVGSPYAAAKGSAIFKKLNKAILASWEKYLFRNESEALAIVQAAVIGQLFAMLSGLPRYMLTLKSFHGTAISWAQAHKMFQSSQTPDYPQVRYGGPTEEESWRAWATAEEQRRIVGSLHILDAEISQLVFSNALLKHETSSLPQVSSHETWTASTASAWEAALKSRQGYPSQRNPAQEGVATATMGKTAISPFQAYIELEAISACVSAGAGWQDAFNENERDGLAMELCKFYENNLQSEAGSTTVDLLCLNILWHATFISLFVDMNRLELAAGREGYEESTSHRQYVEQWAISAEGRRSAMHSILILRQLQSMPLSWEPAIHVPRALYAATMVWYTYSKYGTDDSFHMQQQQPSNARVHFPEISLLKINEDAFLLEANDHNSARPKVTQSMTLAALVDLLFRIGHWGLSRSLAEQVCFLIRDTSANLG